jgi:hypothetical protein
MSTDFTWKPTDDERQKIDAAYRLARGAEQLLFNIHASSTGFNAAKLNLAAAVKELEVIVATTSRAGRPPDSR